MEERRDYFISYNKNDEKWAEWIAWKVEAAGFSVFLQRWDFTPGSNFVLEMNNACSFSNRIILVLSKNFLLSDYTAPEWASFFANDPTGKKQLLLPIRVEECNPRGLLSQVVYLDFVEKSQEECTNILMINLKSMDTPSRQKPSFEPSFPFTSSNIESVAPRFPAQSRNKRNKKLFSDIADQIVKKAFENKDSFFIQERKLGRAFLSENLIYLMKALKEKSKTAVGRFKDIHLMVVDVDGMSGIIRKHGLATGTLVLESLGQICRDVDNIIVCGRMGDDTFFILVENDAQTSLKSAEYIVNKFDSIDWTNYGDNLYVTCSIGMTEYFPKEGANHFISRAVDAQIRARKNGGNRSRLCNDKIQTNWKRNIS